MTLLYDAVRTPRGKAKPEGALASMKPDELVSTLVSSIKQRTKSDAAPDALILGAVGQVGAAADHYADILGRDIDHRHTIAHAPPISDGAGLALVGAS